MEKNEEQASCNGDQHEADPADNLDEESAAKAKLTDDPSKVKFTQVQLDGFGDGKNGDAKVDIHVAQTTVGMGKEELMKYANEPFWVRLRMFLFLFFWFAWVAMLVGAVVIIILAPRCPPAPKLEWYQKTAIYQVDVKTFQDLDGSGVGDFDGIANRVDYFKEQHIEAVLLSDFYKSSDTEGIVDHKEVDSAVGTLADFDKMVDKLREKDIRIIIDFNPNHSSDEHHWFSNSVEGQEPYKDFYVWADSPTGNRNAPPNNWLNVDGESAWTWNDQRRQFYLHTFGEHMPDLNLRNVLVRQELRDIVKFWLDKGVDGFKVIAASHLIEDEDLRDEPVATPKEPNKRQYKDINHIYTMDQPENVGLLAEWKQILMNFTASSGIPKILMPELSGAWNTSVMYFGNETVPLAELPFSSHFADVKDGINGYELHHHIDIHLPSHGWPTLLVGSPSVSRLASRVGPELVDAIHMVSIFTKGTPIMYNGDELGITDVLSSKKGDKNLLKTVMPWNGSGASGGFSNISTSLPVHPDFSTVNVMVQEKEKQSHLKIFSRLLALRGQPALNFGLQEYPIVREDIFSLLRVRKGSPGYLVAVNLGANSTTVDFTDKSKFLPEMARVEVRGSNIIEGPLSEGDHPKIALNNVRLDSKQAVVFSFVPIFEG